MTIEACSCLAAQGRLLISNRLEALLLEHRRPRCSQPCFRIAPAHRMRKCDDLETKMSLTKQKICGKKRSYLCRQVQDAHDEAAMRTTAKRFQKYKTHQSIQVKHKTNLEFLEKPNERKSHNNCPD